MVGFYISSLTQAWAARSPRGGGSNLVISLASQWVVSHLGRGQPTHSSWQRGVPAQVGHQQHFLPELKKELGHSPWDQGLYISSVCLFV